MMEFLYGHAKAERRAAHIVEGDQAVIAVEAGVFQALGHQGAGVLLKAHGEMNDRTLIEMRVAFRSTAQQDFGNKIVHR